MLGSIIMFTCIFLTAFIFLLIGITALLRDTPMHFWAGSTVDPNEIRDVKAYNKANAVLWLVYGGLYVLAAIIAFFSIIVSAILLVTLCLGGLPVLVIIYQHIYNKYKQ